MALSRWSIAVNIGIAMLFLAELAPGTARYGSTVANLLWMIGAVPMVFLSLMRLPARAWSSAPPALISTIAMIACTALMTPQRAAGGLEQTSGAAIEFAGVMLSQIARLYLGRHFALLPANRGIVSRGPFRLVRHPVYLGWLILTIGFVTVYPNGWNLALFGISIPLMLWRIALEENLLRRDPAYRSYCETTRYRLAPYLF